MPMAETAALRKLAVVGMKRNNGFCFPLLEAVPLEEFQVS